MTHKQLQELAARLETSAKLRDAAASAHSPLEDESDHLRVQRLIQSAEDLRAAARCVAAIGELEWMFSALNWAYKSWVFDSTSLRVITLPARSNPPYGPPSRQTALEAIEGRAAGRKYVQ